MATAVSYNSLSLQDSTYRTEKIEHLTMPTRNVNVAPRARTNGETFISGLFGARIIKITGHIVASSATALGTAVDALQAALNSAGANLDIGYGGGTRRYENAVITRQDIPKEAHNYTFVPFELEFYVPDGVGVATANTTESGSGVTTSPKTQALALTGSADPLPVITVTFDAANTAIVLKIKNDTTGDEIIIGPTLASFAAADVVAVDCKNMTVKLNGTAIDYTGIFPRWVPGANTIRFTVTSTSHTYHWSFVYPPRYL